MNFNYYFEEWKDIPDYEGLYQVSNYGRVKSLKYGKERIMKQRKRKDGYLLVCLYKDGVIKSFTVHRLVASAFIPNPNNLPQVNHKDENKENNCAKNLEWCDRKYNINYGTRNERVAKAKSKQVFQYDKDLNLIKIWDSTNECGRNGFDQGHVTSCCNGERKHHKKFLWSYIEIKG